MGPARWTLIFALACACRSTSYREVEIDLHENEGSHAAEPHEPAGRKFRFSVAAMQSPESTYESYAQLFARVGDLLGVEVDLLQRRTYREVDDLLIDGRLDAALVCTGGYLDLRDRAPGRVEIVAVPVVGGKTTYESLIIVPAATATRSIEDLAGKRFAFTDELSLSGRLYPVHLLRGRGREPSAFFGSTMFTHSHDRSIEAVASGIVDGAAIDSLVYQHHRSSEPERADESRVIHRSPPLGIPPVVASTALPEPMRRRLRAVLLELDRDAEAAPLLRALHFDRFVEPAAGLYDEAALVAAEAP